MNATPRANPALAIAIAAVVMLAGCSTTSTGSGSEDVIAGHYATGFEVSEFVPCDTNERWWVTRTAGLGEQYSEIVGDTEYEPVFVRVRGEKSRTGSFGHLGDYDREFEITEVVEVSAGGTC